MQSYSSKEIREIFLNYFTKNDHQLIQGSSIIPKKDPTLLFINSGMAPMKKYFLGTEVPPYPRLSNVQPCIRTNDIDDIGDRHHLTFFEMMGSWSIGDYYKEKAIELAFDLLVNHFKFPLEKLYATVYQGNPALNIPPDLESIRCWEKVGMPTDHIVRLGEDNFWGPAGDTGPCGPCTEVFFDTGDEHGPKYYPGGHFDDANRYIEIWNAGVFMELNKNKDGNYSPLPMKSVDTGSGIERMYLALNRCNSVYEVDTIIPVYNRVKNVLGADDFNEKECRIVTDHMRTSTILLGEGVVPDKDGRGYIVRRLLRKSIAMILRAKKSPTVLREIVEEIIFQMAEWYPYLQKNRDSILGNLQREIVDFEPVINTGLELLNKRVSSFNDNVLPADFVFELVATYGMPFEIISDYAENNGLKINQEDYNLEYRKHQELSRAGLKGKSRVVDGEEGIMNLKRNVSELEPTKFIGYNKLDEEVRIEKIIKEDIRVNIASEGDKCLLIFNSSPFYAESGGQVGDTGFGSNSDCQIEIVDTQKVNGIYLHSAIIKKGVLETGSLINIYVDGLRRDKIVKNHTATHLLHASLRSVLGNHVVQKGSLVNEHKLRFDFLHNAALSKSELHDVEFKINNWIWQDFDASIKEMNYTDALESGAMALFNENYKDKVRVVNFGNVSSELCGGIHVKSTHEIGIFLISQETSIAKGVRRIEALTGESAYNQIVTNRELVNSAALELSSTPENLLQSIKKVKQSKSKGKEINNKNSLNSFVKEESILLKSGAKVFVGQMDADASDMQNAAELKLTEKFDIIFIISKQEDATKVLIKVNDLFQNTFGADSMLKKWLEPFGGKGGGRQSLAKGGINSSFKLEDVFKDISKFLDKYEPN